MRGGSITDGIQSWPLTPYNYQMVDLRAQSDRNMIKQRDAIQQGGTLIGSKSSRAAASDNRTKKGASRIHMAVLAP
jgi:hypothetical protein